MGGGGGKDGTYSKIYGLEEINTRSLVGTRPPMYINIDSKYWPTFESTVCILGRVVRMYYTTYGITWIAETQRKEG